MQINNPYRFYDPLRNTLDRSSAQWNDRTNSNFGQSSSLDKSVVLSRLSKRRRDLSPSEAHEIKRSTLIPIDKDLVPTNNFQRIQGKQFSVVGIQVKEGQPIPIQQFHKSYKRGPLHQQTVYELKPKQIVNDSLKYSASFANLKTSNQFRRQDSEATRIKTSQNAYSPVNLTQLENQYQLKNPLEFRNNFKAQYATTADDTQRFTSLRSSNLNLNLKKSTQETRKQYKYNLFSMFDEAVNTNCASCGGNQIIATKQYSSWE